MPKRPPEPAGMSPLQALITARMRERGWSPKDVERRGIAHATLHRYMKPLVLKQPPRPAVLQKLANALDLPLSEVQRAADQQVERSYTVATNVVSDDLTIVVAAFEHSEQARAELVALAEKYRGLLREEGEQSNGGEG